MVFSLLAAFALGEFYFSLDNDDCVYAPPDKSKHANQPDLCNLGSPARPDPVLGYAPKPETRRRSSTKLRGSDVLYDVVYSTLDTGWRVTPQRGTKADTAVVLFGCSFTFGEGLEDEQSYPYIVGEELGPRYQVFNFGFGGYGSHQMLAQITSDTIGLEAILKRYKKVYFYYLTIEAHVERCAGHSPWGREGPCYIRTSDNVSHQGSFLDNTSKTKRALDTVFAKSFVYNKLVSPDTTARQEATDLHIAILAKANQRLLEKCHAGLVVLLWPGSIHFAEKLRARGIESIDLLPYFPGYEKDRNAYRIPHDGHPNAKAARIVADVVVHSILKRQETDSSGPAQVESAGR